MLSRSARLARGLERLRVLADHREAAFKVVLWRDDTQAAVDWFETAMAGPAPGGLNLGLVMGPDYPVIARNLARNIRENRLGVLSAVLTTARLL